MAVKVPIKKVVHKSVRDLSQEEYTACKGMNLGVGGSMYDQLRDCRRAPKNDSRVTMAFIGDKLVGCTLGFREDGEWHLHTFVAPDFRRLGIGSMLVGRAMQGRSERPYVYVWSAGSYGLYKHVLNRGARDAYGGTEWCY